MRCAFARRRSFSCVRSGYFLSRFRRFSEFLYFDDEPFISSSSSLLLLTLSVSPCRSGLDPVDGEACASSGMHFSYLVKSYSRQRFFHPSRRLVIFGSDILCFRSRSRRRTKSGASRRGDVTFRVPPGAAVFSRSLRRRADVLPLRAPRPQNAACNCVVLAGLFRLVFKSCLSHTV